jgi:aspartate racemase
MTDQQDQQDQQHQGDGVEQVLGILGGMGPAATVELYRRLTAAAEASTDQEHPRIIIDSNAKVPDRTAALLDGGADPTPFLLDSLATLQRAGVDVIVMPCNTAHAYLPVLRDHASVPVLDMIERTVAAAPTDGPIGLLATSGTIEVGLYQDALATRHLEVFVPTGTDQDAAMEAIHLVKAGDLKAAIPHAERAVAALERAGAAAILLGCTEFSVLVGHHELALPTLDPLDVLVTAALDHLGIRSRARFL